MNWAWCSREKNFTILGENALGKKPMVQTKGKSRGGIRKKVRGFYKPDRGKLGNWGSTGDPQVACEGLVRQGCRKRQSVWRLENVKEGRGGPKRILSKPRRNQMREEEQLLRVPRPAGCCQKGDSGFKIQGKRGKLY